MIPVNEHSIDLVLCGDLVSIWLDKHIHIAHVGVAFFIYHAEGLVVADACRAITDILAHAHDHGAVGLLVRDACREHGAQLDPGIAFLHRLIDDDGGCVAWIEVSPIDDLNSHSRREIAAAMQQREPE